MHYQPLRSINKKTQILIVSMLSAISIQTQAMESDKALDSQDVTELSTINISGQQQQGPKISTDKLLRVPGAGGDPLKAIEALPGVVLGGFGPFSIRTLQILFLLDMFFITMVAAPTMAI